MHILRVFGEEIRRIWGKSVCPFPPVLNRIKTSELLANDLNMSITRFGDGEFNIILSQESIGFQEYNSKLDQRLREILSSPHDKHILVCIPNVFECISDLKPEPRSYWRRWIIGNRKALRNCLNQKEYGDSLVSRVYLPWVKTDDEITIVRNLKKTWENKNVLVVEGEKTHWGVGNDLLCEANSVKRIVCPAVNAFSKYERILQCCLEYGEGVDTFVLALGPTATVLAYDLAKKGYRALDLGHFDLQYEHMIRNATQRQQIEGKYNNELYEPYIGTVADGEYQRSVVINLCDE